MLSLFKKNQETFAIVCIVIYVVGYSICDSISESIGIPKLVSFLFGAVMSVIL